MNTLTNFLQNNDLLSPLVSSLLCLLLFSLSYLTIDTTVDTSELSSDVRIVLHTLETTKVKAATSNTIKIATGIKPVTGFKCVNIHLVIDQV